MMPMSGRAATPDVSHDRLRTAGSGKVATLAGRVVKNLAFLKAFLSEKAQITRAALGKAPISAHAPDTIEDST